MSRQNINIDTYKLWVGIAAFVIIISGVQAASSILVPFLLSIFIATISAPAIFWLERLYLPRIVAFVIVLAVVISLLFAFGLILTTSVDSFLANMPQYKAKVIALVGMGQGLLGKFGIEIARKDLETMFDPSGLMNFAGGFLRSFSNMISKSFLIFLGVTFFLFETSSLKTKIDLLTKDKGKENPFEQFSKNLNSYLAIKTIVSLITGGLISIGLMVIGVDFALLLGVIAFLMNYIPSIGSVIASLPAILVALVGMDMEAVVWIVLLYLSVNIIMGNLIEPRFLGKGLGLSVVVVFFSLIFWGWVFGPVGMFLAVPLSMTIKIALDSHPDTKQLGMLLSSIDKNSR